VILAVAGFAAAVALAVLAFGPQLMHIAFGKKFDYDRLGLLIVTAGMGIYLSAVTVNQACLAQGQVRRASVRWIGCAAFFVAWCLVPLISDEFRRVEIGFLVTASSLLAMLYVIYRRPHERPEDVPEPGSTEELEGLVAAADEAG
jgi:O-antigen/teichoic acid export membrane protein